MQESKMAISWDLTTGDFGLTNKSRGELPGQKCVNFFVHILHILNVFNVLKNFEVADNRLKLEEKP